MVKFPFFARYGIEDAGGASDTEAVAQGDHYLKPIAAAALIGLGEALYNHGLIISFRDMSSSNGTIRTKTNFTQEVMFLKAAEKVR